MSEYRRAWVAGGSYFFTVALADRTSNLLIEHVDHLRDCFRVVRERHPFNIDAIVVLPDHLHGIWSLPETDANFSMRWSRIKVAFSRGVARGEGRCDSRLHRGERGIWQRRFWEHLIRDEHDWRNHVAYIHINPVKHGLVTRAIDWPHSSLHRFVRDGLCDPGWAAEPMVLEMDRE